MPIARKTRGLLAPPRLCPRFLGVNPYLAPQLQSVDRVQQHLECCAVPASPAPSTPRI